MITRVDKHFSPLTLFALFALLPVAQAQAQSYPAKALRIVVAYAPGGSNDISARAVGQKLTELWGVPVIIDNRPGGGTVIGTELVAKSPPDGYTLLLDTIGTNAINASIYSQMPYNARTDFAGSAGCTTRMCGTLATNATGARLFSRFQLSLLYAAMPTA